MGIDAMMTVKVRTSLNDDEIRSLAAAAFERFGKALFVYGDGHCVERDEDNTNLLHVHLTGRYYGPNYERGCLPDYLMLAEYFEAVLPGCEVRYGGDDDEELTPFGANERRVAWNYFVKAGHYPYEGRFDREKDGPMCTRCSRQTIRFGWGSNYKAWFCSGCGWHVEESNGVRKEAMSYEDLQRLGAR